MGWISIGFALLNTFVNYDCYRRLEILTFLGILAGLDINDIAKQKNKF